MKASDVLREAKEKSYSPSGQRYTHYAALCRVSPDDAAELLWVRYFGFVDYNAEYRDIDAEWDRAIALAEEEEE